ncbi:MAG: sugar phosphate nucleotidyltransferase [Candidatus Nealsonbacteria bacterium]
MNKVVIAAAGQGTRMLHLSKNKSKHLIKVQKKPFLSYLLDNIFQAGYRDIILVVGYREDLIKEFLKGYKPPIKDNNFKITLVNQYKVLGPKEKEYGTACPIKCVKDIVGKNDFIYLCGDNLYSAKDLKSINIKDKYNYVTGIYFEKPKKCGILLSDNGFLKEIIEKPKKFVGNLINVSLYKFTFEIFEKISKIKKSSRGEYEITDAINLLAKEKKVKVRKIQDYWLDFGSPADILKLTDFLTKLNSVK